MVITLTQERIRIIGGIGLVFMFLIFVNFLLSLGDKDVDVIKVSKPIEHESIHVDTKDGVIKIPADGIFARILVKKGQHQTVYKVQWWSLSTNEWVNDSTTYDNIYDAERNRDSWISYQEGKYFDHTNTGEWVIHDE